MKYTPEMVWDDFSKPLKQFILKRITSPEDAEDILQEVFVKIQCKLDQVSEREHIHAWVYTVARNTIIDFYRRKARQIEPLAQVDVPVREANEDWSAHQEMAICLERMVDRLPPIYKEAIHLVEFAGLTQNELSRRQGVSLSGAKSRVQRARKMLKELLLDCCRVETDRRGTVIDYERNKE